MVAINRAGREIVQPQPDEDVSYNRKPLVFGKGAFKSVRTGNTRKECEPRAVGKMGALLNPHASSKRHNSPAKCRSPDAVKTRLFLPFPVGELSNRG